MCKVRTTNSTILLTTKLLSEYSSTNRLNSGARVMKSSTGRWVSGDDFFDRESELRLLESRVRGGDHVLLTGQRRMGKTSIARELGRRLESQGWTSLFTDVEGATSPEDVIAEIAKAVHSIRSILSRFAGTVKRLVGENIQEISASAFRVRVRDGLSGRWRRDGKKLIDSCADHDKRVLLVIDELPIFLLRMLRDDEDAGRVDEFLSWLRGVFQGRGGRSPVLIVSGSIGLAPLVQRLGIPDRINHLYPFRLGPWSRQASVECFERLAESNGLPIEAGVSDAVYERLGIGIPHHVQCFFARLQDFTAMAGRDRVTVKDVAEVYRTELLRPSGQSDLAHYETRLRNALDEQSHRIALEILAEAATQGVFTHGARCCLERRYSRVAEDAELRTGEVLDVLMHDGYLEVRDDCHHIPFRLLKDWLSARFRGHHIRLEDRDSDKD